MTPTSPESDAIVLRADGPVAVLTLNRDGGAQRH